jgi:two-component system LytT family sensor kinase
MLSDLLRFSLEASTEAQVPLQRELEFVEKYLAIMHVRYRDRVRYELRVEPDTLSACVPTFLLQPLVENAIKHGLERKREGGKIDIRAWRDADLLRVSISDTGGGLPPPELIKEGIGFSSTRARLREQFGRRACLNIRNDNGATIEIVIPFRTAA